MRERIARLKKEMLDEKRFLSVEQAKIIHRVHRERREEPVSLRRAYALAAAFDEIEICIKEGELIVGNRTCGVRSGVVFPECGIAWLEDELDSLPVRSQDPFLVRPEDADYIKKTLLPQWKEKALESRIHQKIGQEEEQISSVVKTNQKGRGQGHIIPDIRKWLEVGPAGLLQEAKERMKKPGISQVQREFYQGVTISLQGVLRFYERYASLADDLYQKQVNSPYREDFRTVALICRELQKRPPESYHEALQSVWFLMVCLQMESNAASISLGRLDRYLWKWYEKEQKAEKKRQQLLEDYIVCLENMVEETRIFKHDYKNMLSTMSGFIHENRLRELQVYFDQQLKRPAYSKLDEMQAWQYLKNIQPIEMKGLLFEKVLAALGKGIRVQVEISENVNVVYEGISDLIRILGVFIDNAVEALEEGKGLLCIIIAKLDNRIVFQVMNECENQPDLSKIFCKGYSTKDEGRGWGLYSVRSLLQEHEDMAHECKVEQGMFIQRLEISVF